MVDLTRAEEGSGPDNRHHDDYEEEALAVIDGIRITHRHEAILNDPQGWLTDEIISAFCLRLAPRTPTQHYCSTFFYTKLVDMGDDLDCEWLQRWRRTVRRDAKRIVIPINWGNSHWALMVFGVEERILRYYDSMMSGARSGEAMARVKRAFEYCFKVSTQTAEPSTGRPRDEPVGVLAFLMSKMSLSSLPTSNRDASVAREIGMETPSGQPQQTDGSSCGVFVCWWIARLSGLLPVECKGPDPLRFRKAILASLLSS